MLSSSASSSSLSLLLRHSPPAFASAFHTIPGVVASAFQHKHRFTAATSPARLPIRARASSAAVVCRAASGESAGSDGERLIQHLLVTEDQLPLLLDLQRESLQGRDLSDLATEHSICPSKSDGGMLGWVRKGQMVPEFEEAAFTAPLNKVVRVKTKFGWHLVQALSEREAALLQDIQPEELHTRLQDPSFLDEAQLIDVREPNEISIAAIEGFEAYPLSQFSQWGPQIASKLDLSKDTYLLCHHGVRSLQAAQWLQTQGFRRLYNVAGGIHQYSIKANRTVPTY